MKRLPDTRSLFAMASVATTFFGTCFLWWFVLVGGNPYHAGTPRIYDQQGVERHQFARGEWVYVRRDVCLARSILAEQSPVLYDLNRHAWIALPTSSIVAAKGCAVRSSAFQIPLTLPAGQYEYRNVSRFQNNLVGRDEANVYPPTKIEVIP